MAEHNVNTVKTQIQSLIDLANTTTGNSDTNLTDGVNALVSGYGQGGSDITEIDGMYSVSFQNDGTETARYYCLYNNGIQAPLDMNGEAFDYSEIQGSASAVHFPYYPTKNTILYAITQTITLPSPFVSYFIFKGDGYELQLYTTTDLALTSFGNMIMRDGVTSAKQMYYESFATIDEAVQRLVEISTTQNVSSDRIGTWTAQILSSAKTNPYYLSHDIYTDANHTSIQLPKNPYVG